MLLVIEFLVGFLFLWKIMMNYYNNNKKLKAQQERWTEEFNHYKEVELQNLEKSKQLSLQEIHQAQNDEKTKLIQEKNEYKKQLVLLNSREKDLEEREKNLLIERESLNSFIALKFKDIPFLANLYASIEEKKDEVIQEILLMKKRPAPSAAEQVRLIATEKKELLQKTKIAEFKIKYYENLLPWLSDLNEEESLFVVSQEKKYTTDQKTDDNASCWLSPAEYKSLMPCEKYQLALDRYNSRNKTNVEIGRDYERFVGYIYEQKGYEVYYQGIVEGLDDLGRDLICKNKSQVLIIQCKCWSAKKTIHEKHINQLFGTTVQYYLEHINPNGTVSDFYECLKKEKLKPVFVTSTILSNRAKSFANSLGVEFIENYKLGEYPLIKCNINKETGEKIYHLPFDQQYDNIKMNSRNKFYTSTIKEAEDLCYRRALKWLGNE